VPFGPSNRGPVNRTVGNRTSRCCHRCHLPCLLNRLAMLSRGKRPDGSRPACAWSDLAVGLNSYLSHYKIAFAFSIFLYPSRDRLALRFAFPFGRMTGLPCSPGMSEWVRSSLFAGSFLSATRNSALLVPATYLLVQAYQHLWLVIHNDVYQEFTCVDHTIH